MARAVYRYIFDSRVPFTDVLATLNQSLIAVESIHGESRCRLEARYSDDPARRVVVIDASSDVGQAFNEVFVGYIRRKFGEGAFRVERARRMRSLGARPSAAARPA